MVTLMDTDTVIARMKKVKKKVKRTRITKEIQKLEKERRVTAKMTKLKRKRTP